MKHENLKCMGIMQDNLCHPYILSTTVLSDRLPSAEFRGTVVDKAHYVKK